MLFQAHEALMTNDDVIDQLDVEDTAGLHELLCRRDILIRWGRVAAGVVVAEDEARAVADDGGPEDLRGAQHRAVSGALGEAHLLYQLALGVPQQDAHLLRIP